MILSTLRLQKNTDVNYHTWHFQGVGARGSHFGVRSVALLVEPENDVELFTRACEYVFDEQVFSLDFRFVEAEIKCDNGDHWLVHRTAQGTVVKRNGEVHDLADFQKNILQPVSYPSFEPKNRKLVGAWRVCEDLLARPGAILDMESEDILSAGFRQREQELLTQLQQLLGRNFVVNRGNLLDLYDHVDSYLAARSNLEVTRVELQEKINEVGRYGVRRLEIMKNECVLIQRMQEQLAVIKDGIESEVSPWQVLEKIIFFWHRQHGIPQVKRTEQALLSFANKIIEENSHKFEILERILHYQANFKSLVKDRELIDIRERDYSQQLKQYFLQQKVDLAFFNQESWQKFYQLMDCWLLMDKLSESTAPKSARREDLFIHRQMENPLAIYHLPPVASPTCPDGFIEKLKTANQSIFRIFLTNDSVFYEALVKSGMGWAQAV